MRKIVVLALALLMLGTQFPVSSQGAIRIKYSKTFFPSDFFSYTVDATVYEVPGGQIFDEPASNQSSYAYTLPGVGGPALGLSEKDENNNFVFFTGAFNGSGDAWTEIQIKDSEGIPSTVGLEEIEGVKVTIRGKISQADLALAVCGASWTDVFGKININGMEGELYSMKIGGHPLPPNFDIGTCLPPAEAGKGVAKGLSIALGIIDIITTTSVMLMDALERKDVLFGSYTDLEADFSLPSYKKEEFQKILDKPLDMKLQLGFRSSAALGAGAATGGIIRIESVDLLGLANIDPIARLEIWHYYYTEGFLTKRLMEVREYNIKKCLYPFDDPCPEYTPYLLNPTQKFGGRLYSIIGDWYWRLEYVELDGYPSTKVEQGDTFTYDPIYMNGSYKLIFGFERAAADLVVEKIRTDPPQQYLQQGSEFELNALVKNVRELSTIQAYRSSPLSGEYKLLIKVDGEELMLDETWLAASGDPQGEDAKELWAGRWVAPDAPSMTIEITVDAADNIDEGIEGEARNTFLFTIPLTPVVPDPAFKDPAGDVGYTQVSAADFRLTATVTNLSSVSASNVVVRMTAIPAGQEWGGIIGEKMISSLAGNSSEMVELEWDASGEPPGDYTILVEIDPEDKIIEVNETNNTAFFDVTITPAPPTTAPPTTVPPTQQCDTLETGKKEYQQGDPVTITFTNSCEVSLSLLNSAPWVVKDSQGQIIFSPVASQAVVEVPPGGKESWTWDQKNNSQLQVPPGTYTIELRTTEKPCTTDIEVVEKKAGLNVWFLLLFFILVVIFWRFKHC